MQKFGLRSIHLFGSVARGDNHEGCDLDVCMLFIAINYCYSEDETENLNYIDLVVFNI